MRSVRMLPSSTPETISGSRSAYAGSAKRSATWTTSLVLTMRPKADLGRWRGTRRRCSRSEVGVLCAAAIRNTSPSRRYMFPKRRFANAHRVCEHGLEYRLQLPWRARDDPEHFGGRSLLLQRLA